MSQAFSVPTYGPTELVIGRILNAPRDAVWRCWTEGDLLKQWYCPKPWRVTSADLELVPGGRNNCVMEGPNGERHENDGIWLEIIPGEQLTFSNAFTEGFIPAQVAMPITCYVRLADEPGGGTRMIWGARHWKDEDAKAHLEMGFEGGWGAAADQLEALARSLAA